MQLATWEHAGVPFNLYVHDNEYISNVIRTGKRFFEAEILEFARHNFSAGQQTIVDIGANIGNHALFFSAFLKPQRLICFEPFPPNFALLQANLMGRAEVVNMGLGSREKVCGMRYNPENLGICVLDENIPGQIPVRTLDSFRLENVTLIKSDVEESHVDVLMGCLDTIRRCRPVLLIEGNFDELFPLVQPFGYVCVQFWKVYNTYCFVRMFPGVQ